MPEQDSYVYVSDTKIRALVPQDPRWWARLKPGRAQVGLNAGVKVQIDLDSNEPARIGARINAAEGHACVTGKWYEDGTLTPGEWMFFEGRIGCHVVDLEPSPGAVLFCQTEFTTNRRILLHGSAKHLSSRAAGDGVALSATSSPFSEPGEFPGIVHTLSQQQGDPVWKFWRHFSREDASAAEQNLRKNLEALDKQVVRTSWFRASAPTLAGCAVVSAIVPGPDDREIVIGSPLLLRRARPGS